MEEKKDKSIKELAGDVIQAVFDLSNAVEHDCFIMVGASAEELDKARKLIIEALPDYPESQQELVIECLVACANMDTSKEAEEYMAEEKAEEKK